MKPRPLPVAVLISGFGSNLQALINAATAGSLDVDFRLVASDRPDAPGLQKARNAGIRTACVSPTEHPDRAAWNAALGELLVSSGADLVVLAGFMRILAPDLVRAWRGRMLNIHPSLLPRYRGLHTHRRALAAGDTLHGTSVHYVTEDLDGGPVILQAHVPILPGDDEPSLAQRVQAREHEVYPQVVGWIATGRLAWQDEVPCLDGLPLLEAVTV